MYEEIQIYVADLAAYNAGHLHGVWINASLQVPDMWGKIKEMLNQSPVDDAEEIAIHDHSGFEGAPISEWESLENIHKMAYFVEEYKGLAAGLIHHFGDIDEAIKKVEEGYHGRYESLADYAEQFTEDTTTIPQHLQYYIDYDRMGRDWEMSGDIYTIETAHNEVHVFSNH